MKTPDANPDTPDDAWDALFRQQLGDYTTPPPNEALSRILAGAGAARPPVYGRWLPVSLVALVLIGTGGWLFVRTSRVLQPITLADRQSKPTTRPVPPATTLPHAVPAGRLLAQAQTRSRQPYDAARKVAGAAPDPTGQSRWQPAALPGRQPDAGTADALQTKEMNQLANALSGVKAHPTDRRFAAINQRLMSGIPRHPGYKQLQLGGPGPLPPAGNGFTLNTSGRQADGLPTPVRPAESPRWSKRVVNSRADRYMGLSPIVAPQAVPVSLQTGSWLSPVDALRGQPIRALVITTGLPTVTPNEPVAVPQVSRRQRHPVWFASLTPLYNYQQIDPIHTDAELVSDIRGARPLATDRLGGRLQIGTEWPLTDRLHLRTSLVYQQVRQSLQYAVQSTRPDSVQIVVVNNESVQATPVFTRRSYAETAIWHYAGVSADLVWQLNRRQTGTWQHYLTAGTTLGRYVSRGGTVNGFVQLAYGIERPLKPGLQLCLEPTVQLGWQALTDASQRLQSRPYGYGLSLGLRFR